MYSIIVVPIFMIINTINSKTIKSIYNLFKINRVMAIMIVIALLSLAGIPPLTGFLPKLIVIFKLIETNFITLVFLLIGAYINLYYYLTITFNLILSRNNISQTYKYNTNYLIPVIVTTSTAMLGIIPIII
jgi:NADH-quinone oxidoreductase subunit N